MGRGAAIAGLLCLAGPKPTPKTWLVDKHVYKLVLLDLSALEHLGCKYRPKLREYEDIELNRQVIRQPMAAHGFDLKLWVASSRGCIWLYDTSRLRVMFTIIFSIFGWQPKYFRRRAAVVQIRFCKAFSYSPQKACQTYVGICIVV